MKEKLKIGIIGAGKVGATLTRHFTRLGQEVAVANWACAAPWLKPRPSASRSGAPQHVAPAPFRKRHEALNPELLPAGYDREIQQGKQLADAARSATVRHFGYSSVGSAEQRTGLPHPSAYCGRRGSLPR